jgi:hypothetical protein
VLPECDTRNDARLGEIVTTFFGKLLPDSKKMTIPSMAWNPTYRSEPRCSCSAVRQRGAAEFALIPSRMLALPPANSGYLNRDWPVAGSWSGVSTAASKPSPTGPNFGLFRNQRSRLAGAVGMALRVLPSAFPFVSLELRSDVLCSRRGTTTLFGPDPDRSQSAASQAAPGEGRPLCLGQTQTAANQLLRKQHQSMRPGERLPIFRKRYKWIVSRDRIWRIGKGRRRG